MDEDRFHQFLTWVIQSDISEPTSFRSRCVVLISKTRVECADYQMRVEICEENKTFINQWHEFIKNKLVGTLDSLSSFDAHF